MNPDRQNQLLAKRAQLQVRIRFNEFVESRIVPFLDILNELRALQIKHRVFSFRCIPQEFHKLLREYLQGETQAKYQLADVTITSEDIVAETILEKYPSAHPFRYVLDAPVIGYGNLPDEVLQELARTNKLAEREVLFAG